MSDLKLYLLGLFSVPRQAADQQQLFQPPDPILVMLIQGRIICYN